MSARFEAFLARLYVDADARARFLADARVAATAAALSPEEIDAAEKIDRVGLRMTANSLRHKRHGKRKEIH